MNTFLERTTYPVRLLIVVAVALAIFGGMALADMSKPPKPSNLVESAAQDCPRIDFARAYEGPSFIEHGNENRRILVDGKPVANAFYNGTGWHIQCWGSRL